MMTMEIYNWTIHLNERLRVCLKRDDDEYCGSMYFEPPRFSGVFQIYFKIGDTYRSDL